MSIATKMAEKGMSSSRLAERSGVDSAHVSAYKRGSRTLGIKAATKMAGPLGTTPEALQILNRAAVLKRRVERGDRRGALQAAKGMVEVVEESGATLSEETETELDHLVEGVIEFADGGGILSDDLEDSEQAIANRLEGRDGQGRSIKKRGANNIFGGADQDDYDEDLEDDDYEDDGDDYDAEGRDSQGVRRRPMKGI